MARLGISIYPEHSKLEDDLAYIRLAGSYGFKRIFTCLLSVGDKSREEITEEFRLRIDAARAVCRRRYTLPRILRRGRVLQPIYSLCLVPK